MSLKRWTPRRFGVGPGRKNAFMQHFEACPSTHLPRYRLEPVPVIFSYTVIPASRLPGNNRSALPI